MNPATPFTLSNLNLNLGAPSPATPMPPQHVLHAMSMPMNQQIGVTNQAATMDHMVSNGVIPLNGGDGGFGADASTGGAGIRYQNLDVDQMVERYWPGSY
jgi:hypothetical protein